LLLIKRDSVNSCRLAAAEELPLAVGGGSSYAGLTIGKAQTGALRRDRQATLERAGTA
jgi:hypothetical protein